MKFEDVKQCSWLKYNKEYWFVTSIRQDVCHLQNRTTNIRLTAANFDTNQIETVQPPIWEKGDQIFCVCESNENVHKQIATIIHIDNGVVDAYPYLIQLNNLQHVRDWLTPFEIQKIDY
jgi:hypothetical protein